MARAAVWRLGSWQQLRHSRIYKAWWYCPDPATRPHEAVAAIVYIADHNWVLVPGGLAILADGPRFKYLRDAKVACVVQFGR